MTGVIDRLSRIRSGKGLSIPDRRPEYIDSIRWSGEIYCYRCASPLKRVPLRTDWYTLPTFDSMTGRLLDDVTRFGPTGLMVCEKYEEGRHSIPSGMPSTLWYAPKSFQHHFQDMTTPEHAMYYVDKPPL